VIEPPPTLAGALRRALVRGALLGLLQAPWPVILSFFSRHPGTTRAEVIFGWWAGAVVPTPTACLLLFLIGFTETPVALVELIAARGPASWPRHLAAVALGVSVGFGGLVLLQAWGGYLTDLAAHGSPQHSMNEVFHVLQWLSPGDLIKAVFLVPYVVPIALASYTRLRRVGPASEALLAATGSLAFFGLAFGLVAGGLFRQPYLIAFLTTLAGALLPFVLRLADTIDAAIVRAVTPAPDA
jgi:hypothetical protein